jgi:hypothetical protein
VIENTGAGDTMVAFFDSSTVVLGSPALVRAAIDQRSSHKVKIDAALNDRITSLRQRYDFWGLGERPEGFAPPVAEATLVESIDRFQFGIQVSNGLELTAEIHPRSSKESEKLNAAIQQIAALLKGPEESQSGTSFDLKSEGGTWKLTLSMPEAELKKAIEVQTGVASPATTSVSPAVPELPETGPTAAPEPVAQPVTPAAIPVAPAAPPANPARAAARKPAAPESHDTVILTLPGKK